MTKKKVDTEVYEEGGYLMEGPDLPPDAPAIVDTVLQLLSGKKLCAALLRSGAPLSADDRNYMASLLESSGRGRPPMMSAYKMNKKLRGILVRKLVRDEVARLQGGRSTPRGGWRPVAIVNVAQRYKLTPAAVQSIVNGK